MRKRLAVVLCMVALAAPLALPGAASATTTLTKLEKQVVTLINKKRAAHGLAPLRVNARLETAARAHSAQMGRRQYFSHDSASGETFTHRVIRYGYTRSGCRYWAAGENIAWGTGLYATAVATVNAWMKSPMHRTVILTRAFRNIGLGAVTWRSGFEGVATPVTFFTMDVGRRVR